jgi:RNA polymerase sigma factor (sigma-70 family)
MQPDGFRALMQRVRAGDQAAAIEIVQAYEPVLMRIIRVRLADRRLRQTVGASDIFQSVMGSFFVRAALGQYDLQQPEDLIKLFAVIARNKVATKARRRDVVREGEPLDDALAAEARSPDESPSGLVAMHQLAARARAHLTPDLLALIALREENLTWPEIADRVGGTPEGLRKRLARAIDDVALALGVDDVP